MINPDEIPLWFAIPAATALIVAAIAPVLRDLRRSRRH